MSCVVFPSFSYLTTKVESSIIQTKLVKTFLILFNEKQNKMFDQLT